MKQFEEFRQIDHPALEEEMLSRWSDEDIFSESLRQRDGQPTFTFYEGPPTANGKPGIHHVMSRTIKDTFCRYKTMKGFQVARKAGWDTHGLPVEIEIEKELGLKGRAEVEEFGIAKYNAACKKSVLRYKGIWDDLTTRMGYWVDQENPYITFKPHYIESVWWLIKRIFEKGYLYEGYKIQWYSPGSGTVLSSHEVSLGYKEVQDPSVFIRFRTTDDPDTYFLAWTTTPWTLISNAALAVGKNIDYVQVRIDSEDVGVHNLILAQNLLSVISEEYEITAEFKGSDLLGRSYEPLYDYFVDEVEPGQAWRVVAADYVSTSDGTGIVHTAPAFGADDYETSLKEGLPVLNPISRDGTFSDSVELVAGLWFKDADKIISRDLRERGLLYRHETCVHNYPHDWRKGTPLMNYPVEGWFIRTTAIKERLIELNKKIRWQPSSIGKGRFGDWLENNVDWALSRRRFWGTPLPIWRSDVEGSSHIEVIGSIAELREKCGDAVPSDDDDVDLHRPFIDTLTWPSPDGGTMRRVPDLIDVWFDSGAMPFAQWHYPFENKDVFEQSFPADFIAEGVDQTRGWFYTLHAIAALVMDDLAYRNVVVNGLVLDENGEKMSKTKGNTVEPFSVINKHGVDAVRWYMMSNSPPWENLRFSERGITDVKRKFFSTIANVYTFFATYANIDGFPGKGVIPAFQDRPEMDRWILSRLGTTVEDTGRSLEEYNPTKAARAVESFVEEFSNWYIRRSRRRFWVSADGDTNDKWSAFATVSECLIIVAKLMAPIAPFYSDHLYRSLAAVSGEDNTASVHLARFPEASDFADYADPELEHRMGLARTVSSIVLALRNEASLNVRQPLARILLVTNEHVDEGSISRVRSIILDEVNVHDIEFVSGASSVVKRTAKANFKTLGRRLGKQMKEAAMAIRKLSPDQIDSFLRDDRISISIGNSEVLFDRNDIEIVSEGIDEWLVGQDGSVTVALDTEVTDALREEGFARETVNRIQNMRKTAEYDVTDRIRVAISGSEFILSAVRAHEKWIRNETLASELNFVSDPEGDLVSKFEIDSENLVLGVHRL